MRSSFLLSRMIGLISLLSLILFFIAFFIPFHYFEVKINPLDSLYGPYQPQLARLDILQSFLKTALVLGSIWFILRKKSWGHFIAKHFCFKKHFFQKNKYFALTHYFKKRDHSKFSRIFQKSSPLIILAIVSFDIYYSNGWLIETVPQAVFERSSTFSNTIKENNETIFASKKTAKKSSNEFLTEQGNNNSKLFPKQNLKNQQSSSFLLSEPYQKIKTPNDSISETALDKKTFDLSEMPVRIYRSPVWYPAQFYLKPSLTRSAERICWDRATLFPKYAYRDHIAVIDVRGTMMSADYFLATNQFRQTEYPESVLAFLDVQYLVYPFRRIPDTNKAVCLKSAELYYSNWKNEKEKSQEILSENHKTEKGKFSLQEQLDAAIKKERLPLDAALWKIILPTSRVRIISPEKSQCRSSDEFAKIIRYQSDRIEMIVHLESEADLILAEQYWNGWKAIAEPVSLEKSDSLNSSFNVAIEPYQKILRKISLPKGDYRVIMKYRPFSFYCGCLISLISWGTLLVLGTISFFCSPRQAQTNDKSNKSLKH